MLKYIPKTPYFLTFHIISTKISVLHLCLSVFGGVSDTVARFGTMLITIFQKWFRFFHFYPREFIVKRTGDYCRSNIMWSEGYVLLLVERANHFYKDICVIRVSSLSTSSSFHLLISSCIFRGHKYIFFQCRNFSQLLALHFEFSSGFSKNCFSRLLLWHEQDDNEHINVIQHPYS